jgi:hypothetical protein
VGFAPTAILLASVCGLWFYASAGTAQSTLAGLYVEFSNSDPNVASYHLAGNEPKLFVNYILAITQKLSMWITSHIRTQAGN